MGGSFSTGNKYKKTLTPIAVFHLYAIDGSEWKKEENSLNPDIILRIDVMLVVNQNAVILVKC